MDTEVVFFPKLNYCQTDADSWNRFLDAPKSCSPFTSCLGNGASVSRTVNPGDVGFQERGAINMYADSFQ